MINLKSIEPFSNLAESELRILDDLTKIIKYKKNSLLIKKGTIADHMIFLISGIASSIYTNQSKEFIRDFYFPPQIFTEQESFENRVPAKFLISAVTDITCLTISYDNLIKAYEKIPGLNEISYKLLMHGFVNISNRLESLLTLNPEKRYLELLNQNPKLLQRIPLKMIASYLGITSVALSRIRKRISQPGNN